MNELQFASRIRQILNQGTALNAGVAAKLEIDTQLLTDDLPIDAYLDRGFQTWLKKRAAEE
jgi:hypothetical protein